MLVIVSQDKDCRALLDKFTLRKHQTAAMLHRLAIDDETSREGLAERIVEDVYDQLRFCVVEWLQDQGFKVSR
jgi:hypothetical protein